MKKILSLSFIAVSLLFVSCKKDTINGPAPVPAPVQKKLLSTTFDENWNFAYNADGSLKEMSLGDYKQLFSFNPGKVNYKLSGQNKIYTEGVFTMINNRPVSFEYTNFNDQGMPEGTYKEFYTYNAKGLLKRKEHPNASYDEYVYDGNDNLIEINGYDSQGGATQKTEYTYGSLKDLFPQFGYLNYRTGSFLFPALSKNLPVTAKNTDLLTNMVNANWVMTYQLDAQGYVIKGVAQSLIANYSDRNWTNSFQ